MTNNSCCCDLCKLVSGINKPEHLYFEDTLIMVVDCRSCHCPMAVWKEHKKVCDQEEVDYIYKAVCRIFGKNGDLPEEYEIDTKMRSIPDHYHIHLRRKKEGGKENVGKKE